MWIRCDRRQVFPRMPGGAIPESVRYRDPNGWEAPASIVASWVRDYEDLYSLSHIPDWLYNQLFESLYELKAAADAADHRPTPAAQGPKPANAEVEQVKNAGTKLGQVGLTSMPARATHDDAAAVTALRGLIETDALATNWVGAAWLLLKASDLPDILWFPRLSAFRIDNAAAVLAALQAAGLGVAMDGASLANGDVIGMIWDAVPGTPHPVTLFAMPAADFADDTARFPVRWYGKGLEASRPQLYRDVRNRLMRANNQILRVSYGTTLTALHRTAQDSFLVEVLRG
jgi:hypothetical protein